MIILDAGHGGMVGYYTTSGKRSPTDEDKVTLYEGVLNRAIVFELQLELSLLNIPCTVLAPENTDIRLPTRVARSKELHKDFNCFGLSIHSNAFGDDLNKWSDPNYWSVWTSEGETKSDMYAEYFVSEVKKEFEGIEISRGKTGNPSKEKNYYILARTPMPFVLVENFFMNNKEGFKMLTQFDYRRKIVNYNLASLVKIYNEM